MIPIAYLLLVHNQPAHVARLVRALDCEDARFFVHVDQKVPISTFAERLSDNPRVTFLEEREVVSWGHVSMVHAENRLLDAAVRGAPEARRYCLLSGACYPIKRREEIHAFLGASDKEHLRVDRVRVVRVQPPGSAFPRKPYVDGFKAYQGAQWWCLTRACALYLLDFVEKNPRFLRFHGLVLAPDEIFYHAILKASPFAEAISHDFEKGTAQGNVHGCHYIDWARWEGQALKILEDEDADALFSSSALFARKFHETRSARLLDAIDARLSLGEGRSR